MFDIEELRNLCRSHKTQWTSHIVSRLLQRNISQEDVENAIMSGEIIECYPDDYPNPCCLILGSGVSGKKLHVVCGLANGILWMITAYYPDLNIWKRDLKTRKKGGVRK